MARVGLVGDIHGRVEWLRLAYQAFEREGGVDAVLQARDFGVDSKTLHDDPFIFMVGDEAERLATKYQASQIFTPGNHEVWPELLAHPIEFEGYRKIRPHVWILHGGVMTLRGLRIAVLGGATSSDKHKRLRY